MQFCQMNQNTSANAGLNFKPPLPPFAWDCNILENSNWKCANTHYLNLPKCEFIQCNWFIYWLWNYYMLKLTNNIFFWDFNLFYQFSWSQKKTSTNYWCRNLVIHDLVGSLWSKTTPQNFLAFKRGKLFLKKMKSSNTAKPSTSIFVFITLFIH